MLSIPESMRVLTENAQRQLTHGVMRTEILMVLESDTSRVFKVIACVSINRGMPWGIPWSITIYTL